ncbi:MAG: hypothetical protein JW760_01685 [Spirochaetales bacterium]|nr:hypothetical protein [Spirochaetales bacterium]
MNCLGCEPDNLYLYAALCGIFFGAAGARLIRGSVASRRGQGDGISALVPVYLSGAILSALGGVFFGSGAFEAALLLPFGILAASAFLFGLFRRAAGIPLCILSGAGLIFLAFSLQFWYCAPADGDLAELRVVSSTDEKSTLEISLSGESPVFQTLNNTGLVVRGTFMRVHPAWFFIRKVLFYTFRVVDDSESVTPGMENIVLSRVPGWVSFHYTSEPFFPDRFGAYTLRFSKDAGLSLKSDLSDIPLVLTQDSGKN